MNARAERREEIKLVLEYVKVVTSLGVVGTLLFAALQWRQANETAERANQAAIAANKAALLSVYQRIANEWRDHLQTFIRSPGLRPYFEEKKELSADDSNREAVLAIADLRLNVMDDLLTYASIHGIEKVGEGWRNTFLSAFRTSPVLCGRIRETQANYGLIVPISRQACPIR